MQFAGTSWHELNYIRQAVGFLVKTHSFFSDRKLVSFVIELALIKLYFVQLFDCVIGYTPEAKKITGRNQAGPMPGTSFLFGFRFLIFESWP